MRARSLLMMAALGASLLSLSEKSRPFIKADTERLEITRADAASMDDHFFAGFRLGLAFDAEIRTGKLTASTAARRCACGLYAGQRLKSLKRLLKESCLLTLFRIPGARKRQVHCQYIVRIEPEIHLLKS